MKKTKWIFIGLIALVFISACRRDSSQNQAPEVIADTLERKVPLSYFRIPVSMPVKELEEFINQKITGEFLETRVFPIARDSHLVVKVNLSRYQNIKVRTVGKELQLEIPLRAVGTIAHSRINLLVKDVKPVEADLLLTLQTPAKLDRNWHLQTKLRMVKKEWKQKPVFKYTAIQIDLSKSIDNLLDNNGAALFAKLDSEINKSVSLQKPVAKIWKDIQKPMLVIKKSPQAWISFSCSSISGEFHLSDDHLVCETEIEAKVSMVTDTNLLGTAIQLPPFQEKKIDEPYSEVSVYGYIPFSLINFKIDSLLKGKKFGAAGLEAQINSVKAYPSKQGLCIECKLKGDVDAALTVCGKPVFDASRQKFSMEKVEYFVNSDNALLNAGDDIMHTAVRDSLQSKLIFGMDTLISKIPQIIEKAIAKGKTGQSIEMDIENMQISACELNYGAAAIHVLAETRFLATLNIIDLRSKKRLMIRSKESEIEKRSEEKHEQKEEKKKEKKKHSK